MTINTLKRYVEIKVTKLERGELYVALSLYCTELLTLYMHLKLISKFFFIEILVCSSRTEFLHTLYA